MLCFFVQTLCWLRKEICEHLLFCISNSLLMLNFFLYAQNSNNRVRKSKWSLNCYVLEQNIWRNHFYQHIMECTLKFLSRNIILDTEQTLDPIKNNYNYQYCLSPLNIIKTYIRDPSGFKYELLYRPTIRLVMSPRNVMVTVYASPTGITRARVILITSNSVTNS